MKRNKDLWMTMDTSTTNKYDKTSPSNFCCDEMQKEYKELRDKNLVDHSLVYDKRYRRFSIYFNEEAEQRDRQLLTDISWCPWCGNKLPRRLSDEWWDILEKEYNITDPIDDERAKVPAEFWTDEWWKKRNL